MMRFDKLVFSVLFFVVFTGTVLGSTAELDLFPQRSTAVVDDYTAYELRIQNTGTTEDRYRLASTHSDEIDIAPTRIPETGNLEPGESATAQIWFNPDLDREEGVYDFILTATSSATSEDYSVEGTVEVVRDHDVNIDVESPGIVCRGEEAKYQVYVSNEGSQKERFKISADAGYLSQNLVSLDSGETEVVTLTRSSDLAVEDRAFNIKAESTSSFAKDTTSTTFIVENCYETSMDIEADSQEIPAFKETTLEVTVTNEGTRSVNVPLSTTQGELEDEELNIASGDSATTELYYTPEEPGTGDITVTADGEAPSSASTSLEVYNGQNAEIRFGDESSVCENTRFEKQITVENTGEASDTFSIEVNRGELSQSEVDLQPGEQRTVYVDFDSSQYEVGGSYDVEASITAERLGEPVVTETSSFTVENCWDLNMDVVEEIESAGENRSVIYEVSLENTGTRTNTYTVSIDAPEWISVRPGQVTVTPDHTGKAYIYAGIPFNQTEGTFDITATATGEQVEKSQTVQLLVGDEVKDAVDSKKGRGLLQGLFNSIQSVADTSGLTKLLISVLGALILSAAILYREW